MIRCAIYDRVSHDLQVEKGLSLDTQKEALTEYAISHEYHIVGYYEDEGITARKKLQNRKAFTQLMNDVQQDRIDIILVTKLDRWFRNVKDYHNTQAVLEAHHCNWKTIFEDYDTSTADGQLKINIMLAVAQNECDRTSERIKVVFDHKRKLGEHLTGAAPYGYCLKDKKLAKDETTKSIVDDIFSFYFSSYSKRKTIYYITDKYGEKGPSAYQINRILKAETYAGIYKDNKAFCEPYITEKQYLMIKSMSDSKTYAATRQPYLFSQIIKCPLCGANLTGFVKKQKLKNGSYSHYKRYRCHKKFEQMHQTTGPCITESVIEAYMTSHVISELNNIIYNLEHQTKPLKNKNNITKIKGELSRLNILFQKGRISEDYYDIQYESLSKSLNQEKENTKTISIDVYKDLQKNFSGDWLNIYNKLDEEHKKTFWRSIIKDITIDPKTNQLNGFHFLV